MASILRTPGFVPPSGSPSPKSYETLKRVSFSFKQRCLNPFHIKIPLFSSKTLIRLPEFLLFAANGETTETNEVEEETRDQENSDEDEDIADGDGIPVSAILTLLHSYKEAIKNIDESKVDEIEAFLQSFEEDKNSIANKVTTLSEELSGERDRILRISADFDNFRKRIDRERLSLVTNVQGEVVESMLPVLDNFERAKSQIKVETEGEEKISNSYQSIYKQFGEILRSLGILPVETVGNPFDPLMHEAIMREDSEEFEEDMIIQEFRKGFKLGDRLLRASMVKVSAGPGPENPKEKLKPLENEEVITGDNST